MTADLPALNAMDCLPSDAAEATLVGRLWQPGVGPVLVPVLGESVHDLSAQAIGPNHQYPDGMMLFLGTMMAPTQDRMGPGLGFTHRLGDVVRVSAPRLGTLVNRVQHSNRAAPWRFGIGALMQNLARRKLL